jgi:hypothetical protein
VIEASNTKKVINISLIAMRYNFDNVLFSCFGLKCMLLVQEQ